MLGNIIHHYLHILYTASDFNTCTARLHDVCIHAESYEASLECLKLDLLLTFYDSTSLPLPLRLSRDPCDTSSSTPPLHPTIPCPSSNDSIHNRHHDPNLSLEFGEDNGAQSVGDVSNVHMSLLQERCQNSITMSEIGDMVLDDSIPKHTSIPLAPSSAVQGSEVVVSKLDKIHVILAYEPTSSPRRKQRQVSTSLIAEPSGSSHSPGARHNSNLAAASWREAAHLQRNATFSQDNITADSAQTMSDTLLGFGSQFDSVEAEFV